MKRGDLIELCIYDETLCIGILVDFRVLQRNYCPFKQGISYYKILTDEGLREVNNSHTSDMFRCRVIQAAPT